MQSATVECKDINLIYYDTDGWAQCSPKHPRQQDQHRVSLQGWRYTNILKAFREQDNAHKRHPRPKDRPRAAVVAQGGTLIY